MSFSDWDKSRARGRQAGSHRRRPTLPLETNPLHKGAHSCMQSLPLLGAVYPVSAATLTATESIKQKETHAFLSSQALPHRHPSTAILQPSQPHLPPTHGALCP